MRAVPEPGCSRNVLDGVIPGATTRTSIPSIWIGSPQGAAQARVQGPACSRLLTSSHAPGRSTYTATRALAGAAGAGRMAAGTEGGDVAGPGGGGWGEGGCAEGSGSGGLELPGGGAVGSGAKVADGAGAAADAAGGCASASGAADPGEAGGSGMGGECCADGSLRAGDGASTHASATRALPMPQPERNCGCELSTAWLAEARTAQRGKAKPRALAHPQLRWRRSRSRRGGGGFCPFGANPAARTACRPGFL